MRRISTYDEFKRWLIAAIDKSAKYRLTRPDLFFAMRDELMLNFDREKVVDMTASFKFKVLDLNGKVRRYSERMKRSRKR